MKTNNHESPVSLKYRAYQFLWASLDLVYPPTCCGCGIKGVRWCSDCQSKVEVIGDLVCPSCGCPQKSISTCGICRQNHPPYAALRSWSVFKGPLREALHHLKYKKDISLGDSLSKPLISFLRKLTWDIDLVTPVPLSAVRLKQRGYNQAALLAWPVAMSLHFVYSKEALLRIKESKSQVGLSFQDRRTNVAGVFWADSKIVSGKNVLVIDDVTTTGATIESCALSLSTAGAKEVYGLTLSRAVLATHNREGL